MFLGVFCALCAILAVSERHRGDTEAVASGPKPGIWSRLVADNRFMDIIRAVGSALVFLSLALLTNPAPTCLFPDTDPASVDKTYVPRYANACVCTTLVVVLSALAQVPGFVTDPKLADMRDSLDPKDVEAQNNGKPGHTADTKSV